ncbi:MAG: hypothetical protein SGILL_006886 [Bacillariaceae sp.]
MEGRAVAFETLQDFRESTEPTVLVMDDNSLILDEDRNYGKSADYLLTQEVGFDWSHLDTTFHREIAIYLDPEGFHPVLLHRPFGIASDSRKFISMWMRVRRGLTVAILTNLQRLLRGEAVLSENDRFWNPIYGTLGFQTVMRALHFDPRHAAVFFRYFVTDESVNALTFNGLAQAKSKFVCSRLYNASRRGRNDPSNEDRVEKGQYRDNEWLVYTQARCILANHRGDQSLEDTFDLIKDHLGAGVYPSLLSFRFQSFLENNVADPTLKSQLQAFWNQKRANKGNSQRGEGKAAPREKVEDNDDCVRVLLRNCGQGEKFWIRLKKTAPIPFTTDYYIFDAMTFEGLRRRFRKTMYQDNCSGIVRSEKHTGYGMSKTKREKHGYRLCYLHPKMESQIRTQK